MHAGRRNVCDVLSGETILFQSNKPARRTASPRTADLSGDLDDSNRDEYGRTWYLAGKFSLGSFAFKGEKNTFSCSEKVNEYLKMTVMGDTLKIVLDYSLIDFPQEFKESKYVGMITGDMQLNLTSKVECVINDIYMQKIALKKLTKDSISIDTPNSIMVDSCDFRALSVIRGGRNVEFQSGNINNLHLNLNRMNNWSVNVEECHIDTEYLTGQNASVQLQKGECRRMFWIPEKDDSKLKVTLTEKACVTVME